MLIMGYPYTLMLIMGFALLMCMVMLAYNMLRYIEALDCIHLQQVQCLSLGVQACVWGHKG